MPRKTLSPVPSLRWHNGAWKIIWCLAGKQYSVSTGLPKGDKLFADKRRAEFAIALQRDYPDFPEEYANFPAVERYITDRYGAAAKSIANTGDWIADYEKEIKNECSEKWADMSVRRIQLLAAALGGIEKATPAAVSKYLAEIISTRKTGTRNRFFITYSRFFKWAVRTHRIKVNPVAGIKQLKEEKHADIVHCTPKEREEIIALAKATGREEWMAIPIAFYAGMRREEISRLEWPDVRFREGLIMAHITKTHEPRPIPLNATLESLLLSVPLEKRTGCVVVISGDIDRILRMDNLVRTIRKMKRAALLEQWSIPRPKPSRSKEYKELKAAWLKEKKKRDEELKAVLDRIGWNPFRHTFGSLLAQAGVSLDKISAWMGNTPEVCKRHYAQFVPRDRRDHEIDRL
jgi:integrase